VTRPLAVLRPEPGNAATAGRIEALGLIAIRLPLFAVRPLDWVPPDPADHDALLLTSANAVRFGGPGLDDLKGLPVLAVGANTAESARSAGFDVMTTGQADAASLLAEARAKGLARMLHLGGRERSLEAGPPIARAIAVYASEVVPIAATQLRALIGTVTLLHSARAARRLGELIDTHDLSRGDIRITAFSDTIASAAGSGWAGCGTATAPNDVALIAAARALAD